MRRVGRISEWNDDRGFGFVLQSDGGPRAFIHIKAFQRSARRPQVGDLISYLLAHDEKGRLNASTIRFAGQKVEVPAPYRAVPRPAIAIGFALIVVATVRKGDVPVAIGLAYLVASLLSYWLYFVDKSAAGTGKSRTPENTLHVCDLLGGWPGALLAQHQFRHKTVKASFQRVFWFCVVVNVSVVGWLVTSGRLARWMQVTAFG
jgi:uncharacterized membrane protein YsdA (DUF1294 family)/cold shock CspA family protein